MDFKVSYFLAISIIAIFICCYDKIAAKSGKRRVSENMLLLISAFGGSVAMYSVMRIIRHKTRHNKFMVGLPIMIVVQILTVLLIYYKFL